MIRKHWTGVNYLSLESEIGGLSTGNVEKVTIALDSNMHDMATISVSATQGRDHRTWDGSPIRISWGLSAGTAREFCGYVREVSPVHHITTQGRRPDRYEPGTPLTIMAVGASAEMNNGSATLWENIAVDQLVATIASRYRFSSEIDPMPTVWPRFAQTDGTDWDLLARVAETVGFCLTVHGTTLRFLDPLRAVERTASPVVLSTAAALPAIRSGESLITSFQPTLGSNTARGRSSEYVTTVLDASGQFTDVSTEGSRLSSDLGAPLTTSALRQTVVGGTYEKAQAELDGIKRQRMFATSARVVCYGNAFVIPGQVVVVQGVGNDYDGHWMVGSAEHTMQGDRYQMTLGLLSDAVGYSGRRPTNDSPPPMRGGSYLTQDRHWVSAGGV